MQLARLMGLLLVCAALIGSTAVVAGGGATEVRLSPADENVVPGATVEYDVVVAEASDGVGSFDATVALNDSSVATIERVRYADSPAYANQPDSGASVQLAATGMNTLQSGPVELATVTVRAQNPGTVGISVGVDALGDENGSAYSVTGTQGRVLTVKGQADGGDTGNGDDSDSGSDDGPTAVAYGPRDTTAGTPVTFNASNSTSETADGIESYEWTFDDGTSANGSVVTHTYDDPGTYRVILRATDSNGFAEDATGIVVDAAPDDSQDDSDNSNSDTGETTDSTNTTDAGSDSDAGNESTSDDDTDEAGTPIPRTGTPTTTAETTSSSPGTTTGGSTESQSVTATTTDTTATEPSLLQPVPLAVVGGFLAIAVGLIYYRRE